jgi:excisionase family DNA binding protein
MPIERRFFRAGEIAGYLNIHPKSVYRAIAKRQIPAVKIPGVGIRVDKQKLDTMLERGEFKPEKFRKV